MLEKDKRLNLISEVMEGIKVSSIPSQVTLTNSSLSVPTPLRCPCSSQIIKLFGWEKAFSKKIESFRDSESVILKRLIMFELVGNIIWNSSPFLVSTSVPPLIVPGRPPYKKLVP